MKFALLTLTLLFTTSAQAKLVGTLVDYKDSKGTVMEGYLVYDDAVKKKRAGVLVVHEWMGLGAFAKSRADMLAKEGYVAFAADIYGKGIRAKNPDEAKELATKYRSDRPLLRERVNAALKFFKTQPMVDKNKIAAIGFCFGGTTVLELARSGADLDGVVSFHGGLSTANLADAKNIRTKVLVLHGADDPHVPEKEVQTFMHEMRTAGVDWQFVAYSQSVHSFTNPDAGDDPTTGNAYNPTADKRSWIAMRSFFKEIF
jgi:dienelactone hydrolase